ncbi:hypothetical protein [uncultured Tenacibaculum sp.]|uniref:hypothetical protein n=1 Tax=uncultured Tenacibaculum sp. TaxID=174713 RepID=UPI00260D3EF4|nr:hypothetical protein [uncultured Tenacibaculum sp.]
MIRLLEYFIYLNIVISTSAGLLIMGITNYFSIDNYILYGFFGFFSTLSVYNIQRLVKSNINKKTPWLNWVSKHKKLVTIISCISSILAILLFVSLITKLTPTIIILISISILISCFYVIKIKNKSLRELPYVKIHSIALTWTAIIVAFPLLNEHIYTWRVLIYFIPSHYLYFIAIAIPFDIRDLKYDLLSQRTIPQVVGVKCSKIISIILLILSSIGLGVLFSPNLFTYLFVTAILVQVLFILFSAEKRQEYYYSLFIDGAIGLLGLNYLIL